MIEIYEYVRNKKGNAVGCILAVKDPETNEILFGYSKYATNIETKRFCTETALCIARNRAITGRHYTKDKLPFAIQKKMDKFSNRAKKYFTNSLSNYTD